MTTSYTLVLTCRRCGHELTPVAQGKPTDAGQSIRATCECQECGARWLLSAEMHPTSLPPWSDSALARSRRVSLEEKAARQRTLEFARTVGVA